MILSIFIFDNGLQLLNDSEEFLDLRFVLLDLGLLKSHLVVELFDVGLELDDFGV